MMEDEWVDELGSQLEEHPGIPVVIQDETGREFVVSDVRYGSDAEGNEIIFVIGAYQP